MSLTRIPTLVFVVFPLLCQAEVKEVGDNGFTVSHTISTPASPAQSWQVMTGHIDTWWDPAHSWSGDSKNLYITAEAGGCFCERLPADGEGTAGGVEHLRIIYINPPHELRFDGSLGPLQSMSLHGRMIWTVKAAQAGSAAGSAPESTQGSTITFTYMVHGALQGGFAGLAPAVDGVIGLQLNHLAQKLAAPE